MKWPGLTVLLFSTVLLQLWCDGPACCAAATPVPGSPASVSGTPAGADSNGSFWGYANRLLDPLRRRVNESARTRLVTLLESVFRAPVSIGALRVSFVAIEADEVAVGSGASVAHIASLRIRLIAGSSLRDFRPIGEATVDGLRLDLPRLLALFKRREEAAGESKLPEFDLRALRVNGASVRVSDGGTPVDVAVRLLKGRVSSQDGRLQFAATAMRAEVMREQRSLLLRRVRAVGGDTDAGWRLTALHVKGPGIELRSGPADANRLPLRGRIALSRLALVNDALARADGIAALEGAVVWNDERPTATLATRVPRLRIDGRPWGEVGAAVDVSGSQARVARAYLEGFGGRVDARGTMALAAPLAYEAQIRWASLDVKQLAGVRVDPAAPPLTASGSTEVSGTIEPLAVRGVGEGSFAAGASATPIAWKGEATYADGTGRGELRLQQSNANTARVELVLQASDAVSGALEVTVADPAMASALLPVGAVPNVGGWFRLTAQVSGTTAEPRVRGEIAGRDVALLRVTFNRLGGAFVVDRHALRTDRIVAELWRGNVTFAGTLALDQATENDWQVRIERVPGEALVAIAAAASGALPPIGRGELNMAVAAKGPWRAISLSANGVMREFWLTQQWIQHATIAATARWPQWEAKLELHNTSADVISLQGSGGGVDAVVLTARAADWKLTALQRGDTVYMDGIVTLDAALRGPLQALSGTATVTGRELIVGGRAVGPAIVEATATRGTWDVTAALPVQALRARARLRPEAGAPVRADVEWTDAEFGGLIAPGSDLRVQSTGRLHLESRLGALARFDADARVDALRISGGAYELANVAPVVVTCVRGACRLDALELRGTDTQLRASGDMSAQGAVRLAVTGRGDLRLLELAAEPIQSARGTFTVDADVRRSAGGWNLSGQMALAGAAVDIGAPVAITEAAGRLTLAGTTVTIDELRGRMGTGEFAIAGAIDLQRGPELRWTLSEVGADLAPSLEAELSGAGAVDGTWQALRVAGELRIDRLLYDRNIALTDFLPSLNRALAAAPRPASQRRVMLDLHIVAPGELYVENNIAQIEARADLRITGTVSQPVVDGRIEVLDGQVTFRDRVFDVVSATIDFRPDLGLAAALNIFAESTIDTPDAIYVVTVRVTGTTADPHVVLASDDPALSDTDVATLIALGQTTEQLRRGGRGFSVYDAIALGANPFSREAAEQARDLLPVDRVEFEPTFSRTTGAFEPQLKLGKDLTDNLAVSLGQTFGVESRTSAEANYRLSPHVFIPLTWESQTDKQEGAFGFGLKLRYEFWRLTPFSLVRMLR
ncbi:MAG: translocation/assembly module TamB domain-containing protein [Candidatus Binatia bacterium]